MSQLTKRLAMVAAMVVLAGTAAGAVIGLTTRTTHAEDVQIRDRGTVVGQASADDALAEVSKRVGFSVKIPTYLPDKSLKLEYVDADLGPSEVANPLKKATVVLRAASQGNSKPLVLGIEETGVRFGAPDDRASRLDIGMPSVEAYHQVTEFAEGYWLLTADRGFLITVQGGSRPAEAEMVKMLRSLAQ